MEAPQTCQCLTRLEWNNTFLNLSMIIEGTTEIVAHLIMPLKSIHNKNFLMNKNVFFSFTTAERYKQEAIYILSFLLISSVYLFRAALYKFIFVFHRVWPTVMDTQAYTNSVVKSFMLYTLQEKISFFSLVLKLA